MRTSGVHHDHPPGIPRVPLLVVFHPFIKKFIDFRVFFMKFHRFSRNRRPVHSPKGTGKPENHGKVVKIMKIIDLNPAVIQPFS